MEEARTSSHELAQAMDRTTAIVAAASVECLRAVAAFDEAAHWQVDGATSMTAWLAARYGLAKATAREWVRVAHALKDLPAIAKAYSRGHLSWDQVRPVTRFATPESDALLAKRAPDRAPVDLWVEARRHERVRDRQAENAHRRRYAAMWWDPEKPLLYLRAMLPGEQGAAFETALSRRAEEVEPDPQADSPMEARLADALTDLVTGAGPGGSDRGRLVVHADAHALSGSEPKSGPSLSETETGQRLSRETVRRLACDGLAEWVLESGGRPVGIGRRGRTVPGQVARLLRHRDRSCRFPGCEFTRWLHAHHMVHWAAGGATNLDNLILLCHAHHRLLHEGGWKVSGHPGQDLRFHDPHGRPLRRARAPTLTLA